MTDSYLLAGRQVQGSLSDPNTKNKEGQPLLNKDNSPRCEFFIGLAVPKNSPEWPAFIQAITAAAQNGHPQAMNAPGFSWKWFDADTLVDTQGVPYSAREGFAGNYIVKLSTGFAPMCCTALDGPLHEIPAINIKRGDYLQVGWSTAPNTSSQSPGVYINLHQVQLIGYGPEIKSGPSIQETFNQPVALPAGASATPVGPSPVTPVAPPVAPVTPVTPVAPPVAPVAPVTPNPAVMEPPPPTVAAPYTMSPAAVAAGITYEALKGKGWSDEQMNQHGHIVDFIPY